MQSLLADNPVLSKLLAYWQDKKGGRSMPRRRDIDPTEIPRLLPHIQFLEREDDGRFRYRLTGTAIVEAYGCELTGRYVDEVLSGLRLRSAQENYRLVLERRQPIFSRTKYLKAKSVEVIASRLLAPLSDDTDAVKTLLCGMTLAFNTWPMPRLGPDVVLDPDVYTAEMTPEPTAVAV